MTGALEGLRVLDLSRFIAGPYCAMLLGDLGADVVKAEKPGTGEEARLMRPRAGDESFYLLAFNRNKRGITVDFRDEGDQRLLARLAERADVLVENFRPGTLEKMGLAPDELLRRNPGLIVARCSGFGQDGPQAGRTGFDAIAQAESGLMSISGEPGDKPMLSGTFMVDYSAGMQLTIGVLAALADRRRTGRGQVVDVALLDTAFSLMMTSATEYLMRGEETGQVGNRDRYGAPGNTYRSADGWVHVVGGSDAHFPRLLTAMGRPELADDPRFRALEDRLANRDAIDAIVGEWTAGLSCDKLVAVLEAAGVPCGRVNGVAGAVGHPQLRHREMVAEVEHPALGPVPLPGVTVKLSRTPGAVRLPPPRLGEHTDEVLADWLEG
ncbi:CoA transferase [Nonomuraea sp. NPDC046802]|uniref:CaiB/BaiF CoA transferase family protein n=1 Tax=Nonomuraea sp. NPDC046802 TaxID=3154919 RepID=UPI0033EAF6C8